MEHQKPSNKPVSDDELLDLLDNSPQTKPEISLELPGILKFINSFEIKPGRTKIKTDVLYEVYKKTHRDYTINNIIKFRLEIRKHLQLKQNFVFVDEKTIEKVNKIYNLDQKKKQTIALEKIEQFIEMFKITEGSNWVKGKILYRLYKNNIKSHIQKNEFYNAMSLYFTKRENKDMWFKVKYNEDKEKNEEKKDTEQDQTR